MTEKLKKTISVPADFEPEDKPADFPMAAFVGRDDDPGRDVSQPICLDEQGRPLYAPRGIRLTA